MRPVILHQKHARAVARGHPWVYRQAVSERPRTLRTGSEVELAAPGKPFLGRGIYDRDATVAVRVWTQEREERIDESLFARRFRDARILRKAVGIPARTNAFRVVNAEGDRMPGVLVDRWGEWLTMTLQSSALVAWRDRLLTALIEAVPSKGIYVRDDERSLLVYGEPCPEELVVAEPTLRAQVFLELPGKAGLFTDMREARVLLAPLVENKRVLNLFAHTGAFSAMAAGAGAAEVVSVDLSGPYLQVAERNVELTAPGYPSHTALKGDVFEVLDGLAAEAEEFDVVVLDPPTFSSSRRSGTFNIKDRYAPLVRAALRVLAPHGLLACATNFRGVTRTDFLRLLQDGMSLEHADLRVLTVLGQPADHPVLPAFPESAYLHFALCATVPPAHVAWRP